VVAAGAWSRAADADATGEITPGATWFVEEGTVNGATTWRCANTGTVTLGTTAISITQLAASTSYSAGNGLLLTGSVFSVQAVASGGITVGAAGVQVDRSKVPFKATATIGNGSLTSIGVTHNLGTSRRHGIGARRLERRNGRVQGRCDRHEQRHADLRRRAGVEQP
jgi:hypothetical protein